MDEFTDPRTGKTYAPDSAITDSNGDCEVSEFFPGFRTFTVSCGNIQTKTFPAIQFHSGKAETREFVITPAFDNLPAAAEEKQKVNS